MRKVPGIIAVVIALLSAAPQAIGAQEAAWTRKADMPAAWGYQAAAALDTKIYVMGGIPGVDKSGKVLQVYEPASGTWMRRATLAQLHPG